jgi:GTP-binding protein
MVRSWHPDAPDGEWLFAQPCAFVAAAAQLTQIPEGRMPEVAFVGRSNVGKSSLINGLTGRKTLARISQTPGRTRQLNFFDLGGRLMLVDLPGYGYAAAPKHEVAAWNRLIDGYLLGRPGLRRVLLLIDARRGPGAADTRVMAMLDRAGVSYQAILTKADTLAHDALSATVAAVAAALKAHTAAHPDVLATSVRRGDGLSALRGALARLASWQGDEERQPPEAGTPPPAP